MRKARPAASWRRGLPVGLVWGDEYGAVRHPDEAIRGAIATICEPVGVVSLGSSCMAVDAPRGGPIPAAALPGRGGPLGVPTAECGASCGHCADPRRLLPERLAGAWRPGRLRRAG